MADVCPVLEQNQHCGGSAKGCSEVQSGPAIARYGACLGRIGTQMSFETRQVAGGSGFVDVERIEAGKQEVPNQGLAAVNGPHESRDTLGIAAFCDRGFMFDQFSDFGGGAPPDE